MSDDPATYWTGERIGILGGTFDPPHAGHLAMAHETRRRLGLDRILFSVAPHPPHKQTRPLSALEHRVRLVEIAIAGQDALAITHIEDAHETSYTVELLKACRVRSRADLYFIMGADSLSELPSWKDPQEILRLATLVVFARGEITPRLVLEGPAALVVFEAPRFDVSSTELRARLAAGRDLDGALTDGVAEYARRHRLYHEAEHPWRSS